ncbi:MAG: dihydrodipicolinate synthase family protein [Aggregatilineaceae bacterium]
MQLKIKGVIVPLLTPFDEHGHFDSAATRRLVEFLVERGIHGLMPGGTTGEGPLLSFAERCTLAEVVVDAAAERVPVIVHTGAITTQEAIRLTEHAQQIGATAASLITPYYFQYSEQALFEHFAAVARAVPDLPLYLYNNPPVTGNTISSGLIARLVEQFPNIVGLKDSNGSLDTLARCMALRDGHFNTAIGNDGLILAGIARGLDACVSGNANVVPELVVNLYSAAARGDLPTARRLQDVLDTVRSALADGLDLSLFKGILARRGLALGTVRAPLLPAPASQLEACWETLTRLNLELAPAWGT